MKKTREKKAGKRMTKKQLTEILMDLFQQHPAEELSQKYIFDTLRLTTHPLKMLCMEILYDFIADDFIKESSKHRYKLQNRGVEMTGTFQRKSNGKNTFIPDDGGEPILIAERNSAHALNGDKVKVSFFARRKRHMIEAEVVEILERSNDTFVGTLDITSQYAFLLTESRTLANDIFIPKDRLKGGKDGDKAIVKIVEWPERFNNPIGEVVEILGPAGDNNTEMHAILAEFGLPYAYPKNVVQAAEKISADITEEEIAKREDFRDVLTFTCDPADAKDFDDALSIRKLENGLWEVGVHIADVTHYVKEGSVIDKEALNRATSVYLVDRTVPMLPEKLCNNLCSLRPDEEKLTYSVIFEMNEKAEVKKSRIVHTIIKSNRRFCYEEVQKIIENKQGEFVDEILALDGMAKKLREKRFKNGAINFERVEVKFKIDKKGKPLGVYFKESKDANKLIEEFMLLANRTVAEKIGKVGKGKKAKTFVYRVHDQPDPEKLANLSEFISRFGYKLRTSGTNGEISKSFNHMLADIKGKKEQNLIELISIKAMQKAYYSTHNIGHYGLAFSHYTHFTSPIRRYPDMMAHRLLTKYLEEEGRSANLGKYEDMCEQSSKMEEIAAQAERASIKYKQVEFMKDKIGQVFPGVVSSISEWGIYVELTESKCEGLVPIRDLGDDYYEFDEKNYCLRGRRNHNVYQLGDELNVRVARANLEKKQLDFELA